MIALLEFREFDRFSSIDCRKTPTLRMFSRAIPLLKCSIPRAIISTQTSGVFMQRRLFRVRSNVHTTDSAGGSEIVDPIPEKEDDVQFEPLTSQESFESMDMEDPALAKDVDNTSFDKVHEEIDRMYDFSGEQREYISEPTFVSENVDQHSFEEEFFRHNDKIAHDYIEDNINDTLRLANSDGKPQDVTEMDPGAFRDFYHKAKSLDLDDVSPEVRRRLSLIRKEEEEEQTVSKRHTWFNFMPASELPEGVFGSYSSDQIFNALEFDLLARNMREVYKYEKDELFLNEDILKHTKMPAPLEAPSFPNYPNYEKFVKSAVFALDRNANFTKEEKQKVLDIFTELGSLTSEVDESPKGEYKLKRNM